MIVIILGGESQRTQPAVQAPCPQLTHSPNQVYSRSPVAVSGRGGWLPAVQRGGTATPPKAGCHALLLQAVPDLLRHHLFGLLGAAAEVVPARFLAGGGRTVWVRGMELPQGHAVAQVAGRLRQRQLQRLAGSNLVGLA